MATKKIKRPDFEPSDGGANISSLFRQFAVLKKQRDTIQKRENELKKELSGLVEDYGYEDPDGHIFYELPEPVEGFGALKRERRVSKKLSEDRAEGILRDKDVYEDCVKTIVVLDEDAIMQAYYKGVLEDADIDAMFEEKVIYAFVPQKEK